MVAKLIPFPECVAALNASPQAKEAMRKISNKFEEILQIAQSVPMVEDANGILICEISVIANASLADDGNLSGPLLRHGRNDQNMYNIFEFIKK